MVLCSWLGARSWVRHAVRQRAWAEMSDGVRTLWWDAAGSNEAECGIVRSHVLELAPYPAPTPKYVCMSVVEATHTVAMAGSIYPMCEHGCCSVVARFAMVP